MIEDSEAVVLRSRKYGDSSKIVTLFTKNQGKINVIAKASRTIKNKFGSSLEPLCFSRITYYNNKGNDLHLLSSSEIIKHNVKIYDSYEHMAAGLMIAESILQTQEENASNLRIFNLLTDSISFLDTLPDNPNSVFICFQLNFIKLLGFEPDFSIDLYNGINHYNFSIEDGCLVKHINHSKFTVKLDSSTINLLSSLSTVSIRESSDFYLDEKNFNSINDFLIRYFSFHLDKQYNNRIIKLLK